MHELWMAQGWGSALAEAALTWIGEPYRRVEIGEQDADGWARLRQVNPLGQLPTLVLDDGTVLTESAAIMLWAGDRAPSSGLVPAADAPERARFLRFLILLVAAIYPTFTYGDVPTRFVPEDAGDALRNSTDERRKALWRLLEQESQAPYFLGPSPCALDLYLCVMTRWRPRREWFAAQCPNLFAIAERMDADPRFAALWAANFKGPISND
ncbi:MAG: Glutathione S-transferase, N-terminal domain [Rhodospirillales bacterium]|nr:Glutathione S-transferase, N-terminal domain [Rhodospirillales bacterium]